MRRFLTFAALLLAAAPAIAALPAAITDRRDPEERAVNCAAYLGHEINAVPHRSRPPLIAAMRAWRADLERRRSKEEADQYFASTFAVLRHTPAPIRRAPQPIAEPTRLSVDSKPLRHCHANDQFRVGDR